MQLKNVAWTFRKSFLLLNKSKFTNQQMFDKYKQLIKAENTKEKSKPVKIYNDIFRCIDEDAFYS